MKVVAWINKDHTYVELVTSYTVYGSHTLPLVLLKEAQAAVDNLEASLREARAETERVREAMLQAARKVESLKRECGMDPESPIAIHNAQLMSVSYVLRAALTPEVGKTS